MVRLPPSSISLTAMQNANTKCLTTRFIHHSGREAILLEEIPAGDLQEKPNEAAPTATAGATAEQRSNTLTL